MSLLILAAAILTLAIGISALWANPHRLINLCFMAFSVVSAGWLFCVFMAMRAGLQTGTGVYANPIPWVRAASALGAFLPFIVWLMKESILAVSFHEHRFIRRALLWFAIGCSLAGLCYTESFVFDKGEFANRTRGVSYSVYSATSFGLYLLLTFQTYKQWRKQTGIRRLAIQFFILNTDKACLLAILINAAGNYLDLRSLSRLTPLIILVLYGLTAWAVTVHRVFDARQVFLSLVQRLGLVLVLGLGILVLNVLLQNFLPAAASLILSVTAGSTFAFLLERRTREWFRLTPEQSIAQLRRAMTEAARSEPSPDKLVTAYEELLRDWSQRIHARPGA